MAGSEIDIEPCDERMDEIISASIKHEGSRECKIGSRACVKIKRENCCWIGDNCLYLDSINERLSKSCMFEGRVVESIYIVPD